MVEHWGAWTSTHCSWFWPMRQSPLEHIDVPGHTPPAFKYRWLLHQGLHRTKIKVQLWSTLYDVAIGIMLADIRDCIQKPATRCHEYIYIEYQPWQLSQYQCLGGSLLIPKEPSIWTLFVVTCNPMTKLWLLTNAVNVFLRSVLNFWCLFVLGSYTQNNKYYYLWLKYANSLLNGKAHTINNKRQNSEIQNRVLIR